MRDRHIRPCRLSRGVCDLPSVGGHRGVPRAGGWWRRGRASRRLSMPSGARAVARVLVVTRVAAPSALLLVEDSSGGERPLVVAGQLVAATATSIAVGCSASVATEVRIGDVGIADAAVAVSVFDGRLSTPTRTLAVLDDPRRHAARSRRPLDRHTRPHLRQRRRRADRRHHRRRPRRRRHRPLIGRSRPHTHRRAHGAVTEVTHCRDQPAGGVVSSRGAAVTQGPRLSVRRGGGATAASGRRTSTPLAADRRLPPQADGMAV